MYLNPSYHANLTNLGRHPTIKNNKEYLKEATNFFFLTKEATKVGLS